MLKASHRPYQLQFKSPVLTSRGQMTVKNGYYLYITDGTNTGVGECSFIEGLSMDDLTNYESALGTLCKAIEAGNEEQFPDFSHFPSIAFGYECAMCDLKTGGKQVLFESDFTAGKASIDINGLVWMGEKEFMLKQIEEKLEAGFTCIKMKVGALPFEEEVKVLEFIRAQYPAEKIEIRLDANGAFNAEDVFKKLAALAQFHIHSIEQPVKPGQPDLMRRVREECSISIALDEELIGIGRQSYAAQLLETIKPQYLILKPSLLGGFAVCDMWIQLALQHNIGWWATSALESNIGLNAIAQWVFTKNNPMVQGLGTGSLYKNNVQTPLVVEGGQLHYRS